MIHVKEQKGNLIRVFINDVTCPQGIRDGSFGIKGNKIHCVVEGKESSDKGIRVTSFINIPLTIKLLYSI